MANEKRLIDAMRLTIKLAKKEHFGRLAYDDVLAVIADAPTVEAVEVVHGWWRGETEEEQPHIALRGVVCSVCNGKSFGRDNYCPNCGAKMDLED